MSDEDSGRPFRRERNLSNRNFRRRGSNRRQSTESHSSVDLGSTVSENTNSENITPSTPSSSMQITYSVNSDTENAFNRRSLLKLVAATTEATDADAEPQTPDPALLGVRQKVLRFETLQTEDRIIFKTGKYNNKAQQAGSSNYSYSGHSGLLRMLPVGNRQKIAATPPPSSTSTRSSLHTSIDEERSEDDVDDFSDYAEDESDGAATAEVAGAEYVLPEVAHEIKEGMSPSPVAGLTAEPDAGITANACEFTIDDFGKVENLRHSLSVEDPARTAALVEILSHSSEQDETTQHANGRLKEDAKDFVRNYRSTPRPKTEIIGTTNLHVRHKSLYCPNDDEEEEEIELRDKCDKFIQPILEELIKTEETYVENLKIGIENYGNIFQRKDLPIGLRGKKYVLLGNIEQLYEFHRDEFLPMLERNRRDLKRLFDEFQIFIDQNCLYGYVIFTMNKQRSLKLCDVYKNYFKLIQSELDDKLGINSFLVQPIQRMARYPLLLQQFITTLFKNRDFVMKPLIESCCRLEKKLRTLLITTNESEIINDIVDCNEFNVFYQGKFRKVSEFSVFDHTLKRSYRSKVFIFDKCIIYTEIKGKQLVFHGRYPCEHVGITAKTKSFTLFYERRKQQECDFNADPMLVETWLELIRDMINSYVHEERVKLQERYSRENDHLHRKPPSLSLFRDSNRFSSDSGIGNIWVMPKPELEAEATPSPRTTWYAIS